jgi:gas vesicle protein
MSKINVALGTVAGIAAGTLLGVLFAPEKGSDTRKKISTKSKDAATSIKNHFVDTIRRNGGNAKGATLQVQDQDDMN